MMRLYEVFRFSSAAAEELIDASSSTLAACQDFHGIDTVAACDEQHARQLMASSDRFGAVGPHDVVRLAPHW